MLRELVPQYHFHLSQVSASRSPDEYCESCERGGIDRVSSRPISCPQTASLPPRGSRQSAVCKDGGKSLAVPHARHAFLLGDASPRQMEGRD